MYPQYFHREEPSSRSTQLQRIISTQTLEPYPLKVTELLRDDIAVNDNQPVNSILSLNKLFSKQITRYILSSYRFITNDRINGW